LKNIFWITAYFVSYVFTGLGLFAEGELKAIGMLDWLK
jgi:hypothetical protein